LIKDKLKIPGLGGDDATDSEPAKDIGGALTDGLKKLF